MAGSTGDQSTVARLDIGGQSYIGANASGIPITLKVNAISAFMQKLRHFSSRFMQMLLITKLFYMSIVHCAMLRSVRRGSLGGTTTGCTKTMDFCAWPLTITWVIAAIESLKVSDIIMRSYIKEKAKVIMEVGRA